MDSESVPGLGALYINGSGLRIQEFGARKRPAGYVLRRSDSTFESVIAVDHHRLSRTHPCDRFTIWAEHVAVRTRYDFNRDFRRHPDHLNSWNGGSAKSIPQTVGPSATTPVAFEDSGRSEERRVGKECRSRWTLDK